MMEQVTPNEYFETIKSLKKENTDEKLDNFYAASLLLLEKYKRLNQVETMKKLMFIIDTIPKERELLKIGINIFIYKDDIEEYINNVVNKTVKIIELERYPREIPDELVPIIEKTRNIFDQFYILFTDYTGKVERKVEKERRDRDPILFGVFKNNSQMNDRFYYLGDWIDEYCDLTLEKLLAEQGEDIAKIIDTPMNKEELIDECLRLTKDETKNTWTVNISSSVIDIDDGEIKIEKKPKKNLFQKITQVFRG